MANYPSDVGYAWWLMEEFWATIARQAAAMGRPCLLAYPEINALPAVIRQAPIEPILWQVRPRSILEAVRSARRIRELGVASVYLTDWPVYSITYLAWRLAGVQRIVMHDHTPGDRPTIHGPRAWLKSLIHRCRLLSCDAYIGVSDYIRRRFTENGRVPADRCFVVRNGIRTFSCEVSDRGEIRRRIQIPAEVPLVVLVSRATYYKGWDFAIRCVARLARESGLAGSAQFAFCGDGPDLEAFRQLAAECGVADRCHFLGRRQDVRELLCAADLAFHPSRGEALSLATLEFMCAGLPVVVPNRQSVCGVIRDGVDGVVYPAEDQAAAVAALGNLISDTGRRRQMGAAARAAVLEGHQLEHTLARLREVTADCL